ncbi:hypothetical protein A8M77_00340 [Variovorax sp. JS1663]|nr:hypothetical protein A8M77_00340 [Variovorax sp. JS1663]
MPASRPPSGAFANSGQICMSTERIVVDRRVADEFVERFVAKAQRLPLGDPREGPVALDSVVDHADSTLMPATVLDHRTPRRYPF